MKIPKRGHEDPVTMKSLKDGVHQGWKQKGKPWYKIYTESFAEVDGDSRNDSSMLCLYQEKQEQLTEEIFRILIKIAGWVKLFLMVTGKC